MDLRAEAPPSLPPTPLRCGGGGGSWVAPTGSSWAIEMALAVCPCARPSPLRSRSLHASQFGGRRTRGGTILIRLLGQPQLFLPSILRCLSSARRRRRRSFCTSTMTGREQLIVRHGFPESIGTRHSSWGPSGGSSFGAAWPFKRGRPRYSRCLGPRPALFGLLGADTTRCARKRFLRCEMFAGAGARWCRLRLAPATKTRSCGLVQPTARPALARRKNDAGPVWSVRPVAAGVADPPTRCSSSCSNSRREPRTPQRQPQQGCSASVVT